MKTIILLLLCCSFVAGKNATITSTGGTIIRPQTSVTLSYAVKTVWDRCYWYSFADSHERKYCSFDNTEDGHAKLHRCVPESWSVIRYSGSDPKDCKITIKNITQKEAGDWGARVDEEDETSVIHLIVAQPALSASILIGNETEGYVIAGVPSFARCKVQGGIPHSNVTMKAEGIQILSNSTDIFPTNDNNSYVSVKTLQFVPKVEDFGKVITCFGTQYDKSETPEQLFDSLHASNVPLNVTFPPQPQTLEPMYVHNGDQVTIKIAFTANPTPDQVQWLRATNLTANESPKQLQNDEKYSISKLESGLTINSYTAELVFNAAQQDDDGSEYRLNVVNSIGDEHYSTILHLVPKGQPLPPYSTTEITPSPHKPTSGSLWFPILGCVTAFLIIAGMIFIYRRTSDRDDTAPLSSLENN